jgi:hypothetical protein
MMLREIALRVKAASKLGDLLAAVTEVLHPKRPVAVISENANGYGPHLVIAVDTITPVQIQQLKHKLPDLKDVHFEQDGGYQVDALFHMKDWP